MKDAKELLSAIEAGLQGTTAGDWAADVSPYHAHQPRIVAADGTHVAVVGNAQLEQDRWDADARHIAATCPANMRAIIDYVRQLERERDEAIREKHAAIGLLDGKQLVIDQLERERDEARDALRSAAKTFERYAKLHEAKGTPEGWDKAQANYREAIRCREAANPARARALDELVARDAHLIDGENTP